MFKNLELHNLYPTEHMRQHNRSCVVYSVASIKIAYVCPFCSKNHLKDREIHGDYSEDGVLLSFCPKCGRMYRVELSNNKRKIIGVQLAMKCNLNFGEAKETVMDAPKDSFIEHVKTRLEVTIEDILEVVEKL